MPTLRQILAAHGPVLLLDAASSLIQAAWLETGADSSGDGAFSARWATSDSEATTAVFECVEKLARSPVDAGAYVYCEGPGSILGIRTVAMALRTWNALRPRPVFAYCSLAVVAHALGEADASVIADARRSTWHRYRIGDGLRRLPPGQLTGRLLIPEQFRHWDPPPPDATRVPYLLSEYLPRLLDSDLWRDSPAPDAFLHEEPSYVTWTPQIHRAPANRQ